jgi:hypothetical protein
MDCCHSLCFADLPLRMVGSALNGFMANSSIKFLAEILKGSGWQTPYDEHIFQGSRHE